MQFTCKSSVWTESTWLEVMQSFSLLGDNDKDGINSLKVGDKITLDREAISTKVIEDELLASEHAQFNFFTLSLSPDL